VFVDAGGVGGGVVDILNDRGYKKIIRPVMFGAKALADDRYHNRRAEMWDELKQWLGGEQEVSLPPDDNLAAELCAVNKKYDSRGRLQLEEKEELKKRVGRSPDKADALALTFAEPVFDMGETEARRNSVENLFWQERKNNSGW
jgi:hypothetical protein